MKTKSQLSFMHFSAIFVVMAICLMKTTLLAQTDSLPDFQKLTGCKGKFYSEGKRQGILILETTPDCRIVNVANPVLNIVKDYVLELVILSETEMIEFENMEQFVKVADSLVNEGIPFSISASRTNNPNIRSIYKLKAPGLHDQEQQTQIKEKLRRKPRRYNNDDDSNFSYSEVSFGYSSHSYSHFHDSAIVTSYNCSLLIFCLPNYTYPRNYTHVGNYFGCGFTHHVAYGRNERLTIKAFGSIGNDRSDDKRNVDVVTKQYVDLLANLNYDSPKFGLEAGLHYGLFKPVNVSTGRRAYSKSGGKPIETILPNGAFRLGSKQKLFIEVKYQVSNFGINSTRRPIRLLLGSGFGGDNTTGIKMGIATYREGASFVLESKVYAHDSFSIEFNLETGVCNSVYATVGYVLAKDIKHKQINKQ